MNRKPPIWIRNGAFVITGCLMATVVILLVLGKKYLAQSIGVITIPIALIGLGAMVVCDLRAKPPQE